MTEKTTQSQWSKEMILAAVALVIALAALAGLVWFHMKATAQNKRIQNALLKMIEDLNGGVVMSKEEYAALLAGTSPATSSSGSSDSSGGATDGGNTDPG